MPDTRTAADALADLSKLISDADSAFIPLNLHTAVGLLAEHAHLKDAEPAPVAQPDPALADRVSKMEKLLIAAGITLAAAPAPAAPNTGA